jgi:hypothetical protein
MTNISIAHLLRGTLKAVFIHYGTEGVHSVLAHSFPGIPSAGCLTIGAILSILSVELAVMLHVARSTNKDAK